MGHIAAKNKQPSCKFVFPPNLDASLKANQTFTLKLSIKNIETGYFANPAVKYYSAPQVRYFFQVICSLISLTVAPIIDR
jgi:hypothetical protein